jgi:hypothetical protein
MNIVLVIYGSIDQVTGGYLYDGKVVERLRGIGVAVPAAMLNSRVLGRGGARRLVRDRDCKRCDGRGFSDMARESFTLAGHEGVSGVSVYRWFHPVREMKRLESF